MALYEKYGMDAEKAKEWYDGYVIGRAGHVYNPNSVLESLMRGDIRELLDSHGRLRVGKEAYRDEFVDAIEGDKWFKTFEAISRSEELLEATLAGDEETVAACIEKVHMDNTAILTYNNENALSCVIQIAYYSARDDYM